MGRVPRYREFCSVDLGIGGVVSLHVLLVGGSDAQYRHYLGLPFRFTILIRSDLAGSHVDALGARVIAVAHLNEQTVTESMRNIHAIEALSFVFTLDDDLSLTIALIAEELAIEGPSVRATRICVDKSHMRRSLQGSRFDVGHVIEATYNDTLALLQRHPTGIVLKPSTGSGSRNVFVIKTIGELDSYYDHISSEASPPVAEAYLAGRQLSVETLTIRGAHEVVTVTAVGLHEGTVIPDHHIMPAPGLSQAQRRAIEEFCTELLTFIGFRHGPCHIEIKLNGTEVNLIEINNRIGGDYLGLLAELTTGINSYRESVQFLAEGTPHLDERNSLARYEFGSSRSFFGHVPIESMRAALVSVDALRVWPAGEPGQVITVRSAADRVGLVVFASNDKAAFLDALDRLAALSS